MVVREKCPSCQAEVEILLENARKQNACPECGHSFIPRHAINPAGFHQEKLTHRVGNSPGVLEGGLFIGAIIALFVSPLLSLMLLIAAAVVFSLRHMGSRKN